MKSTLRSFSVLFGSIALAGSVQAAWIYLPAQNIPIPTDFGGVSIDIATGANAAGDLAGGDINFFFGGFGITNDADSGAASPSLQFVRLGTGSTDTAANLTAGTIVNGASSFASGYGGSATHLPSQFADGVPGYLGFSLDGGATTLFGWMEVTFTPGTPGGMVHQWGYDDAGDDIIVGSTVPEASEALVLMCGLSGLLLGARRRKRTTA